MTGHAENRGEWTADRAVYVIDYIESLLRKTEPFEKTLEEV